MAAAGRREPLRVHAGMYDLGDASATVRTTPRRWRWLTDGMDRLPGAVAVALEALGDVLEAAGGRGGDLDSLVAPVVTSLRQLADEHGPRTAVADLLDPADPLVIATEECDRLLSLAARAVCVELASATTAEVVRVAASTGGVPKSALSRVRLGPGGLEGDTQADREHHGRPFQAVCLFSEERLAALAGEGHPVSPGSLGENLLLSGAEWSLLRPGMRLAVGSEVLLELSAYVPPCRTVAGSFLRGRFDRIDPDKHPGWARCYAWVVHGGEVRPGDRVEVFAA